MTTNWRNKYPLNTFKGETRAELERLIEEAVAEVVEKWRKSIDEEGQSCTVKIEEAVAEARREFVQEIMSLRGKQILAYGKDKLPFVVWEGKADELEKITIYEQAFKDIVNALTPPTN